MSKKIRCNLCFDQRLIDIVDEKANALSLSRSSYISMVLQQTFQNERAMESVPELLSAIAGLKSLASSLNLGNSEEIDFSEKS